MANSGAMATIAAIIFLVCIQLGSGQLLDRNCHFRWLNLRTTSLTETSCFWFSSQPETFINAAAWCERIDGAHLAEVVNPVLNTQLMNAAQRAKPGKKYWIGLTDIEVEGWYKWLHARKQAFYTNFAPGVGVKPEPAKNCAYMDNKGLWHTDVCSAKYHFICEK